jgi:hypothetical protein
MKKGPPAGVDPPYLKRARARAQDNFAARALEKALAWKAKTEAELKRLKMPLKAEG